MPIGSQLMPSKAELKQFKQWQREVVALDASALSELPALPHVLPLLSAILTTLKIKPEQGAKRQKLETISFEDEASPVKEKTKRGKPKKSLKV